MQMPVMEGLAGALYFFQNVGSLGRPDKRFWFFIVMADVLVDGDNQLLDAAKDPAAQAVLGQVAEESLHHVQPGATRGSEVHVETWMTLKELSTSGLIQEWIRHSVQ